MTDNPKPILAKRVRAARPRARKYNVWDTVISGVGQLREPAQRIADRIDELMKET